MHHGGLQRKNVCDNQCHPAWHTPIEDLQLFHHAGPKPSTSLHLMEWLLELNDVLAVIQEQLVTAFEG